MLALLKIKESMKGWSICIIWLLSFASVKAQDISTVLKSKKTVVQTIEPIRLSGYAAAEWVDFSVEIPMPWRAMVCECCSNFYRISVFYTLSPNAIACGYPGVQSINRGTPCIRGAGPEGTAYYIDGIRVRLLELPME
jgi:hypothetical protein